ncbi:hypothetical protein HHO41_00300 [Bacillus sp. DNRA2]|uniref:hypothetical protein n=1 Tax=Bacillus sp. DNRA2 TaxID=2723053 RepID=UPI00145D02BE|nr:hypothetical protein [Bacillus sp. DNRA2]NMD68708.1 hypothetical protein [Bacillus sp. DNRA2]
MNIGIKTLSLFVGYSFCLFLSTYSEFFLKLYIPVMIAVVVFPFLLKFPDHILLHFIISIATAIPISTLLIKLVPENILIDINLGAFHLTRLETALILVGMLLVKLPYFGFNWLSGVAKNALFAASFLILLTQLSLDLIPDGFDFILYIATPLLLPVIYHTVAGKIKAFRTLAIAILSYTSLVGLDYYFIVNIKGSSEFLEASYPGFQIIDYLIPVTFLVTLLIGYNPLKSIRSTKNEQNQQNSGGDRHLEAPR